MCLVFLLTPFLLSASRPAEFYLFLVRVLLVTCMSPMSAVGAFRRCPVTLAPARIEVGARCCLLVIHGISSPSSRGPRWHFAVSIGRGDVAREGNIADYDILNRSVQILCYCDTREIGGGDINFCLRNFDASAIYQQQCGCGPRECCLRDERAAYHQGVATGVH